MIDTCEQDYVIAQRLYPSLDGVGNLCTYTDDSPKSGSYTDDSPKAVRTLTTAQKAARSRKSSTALTPSRPFCEVGPVLRATQPLGAAAAPLQFPSDHLSHPLRRKHRISAFFP